MKPGKVPPLAQLCAGIKALHTDRAALVREPKDGRPEGLLILMLSTAAICDLGPIIIEHVKTLKITTEQARHSIQMDERAGAAEFFNELERLQLPFAYCKSEVGTIAILLGHITPKLCADLTAQRCPTQLK